MHGNPVVVNPALDPGPGFGPEPFHTYGTALDGDMMVGASRFASGAGRAKWRWGYCFCCHSLLRRKLLNTHLLDLGPAAA